MANTLYHNPRCSKSRQAKQLLEEKGIDFDIVEYLKTPLDEKQVADILAKLGIAAHDLLRKKEAEYKEQGLSKEATEAEIITAVAAAPRLLERPILITEKGARIGRPTKALLEIL